MTFSKFSGFVTHPIKGELISQGENVDMQEKQPKRITEKVKYLENGGLSLTKHVYLR